MQIFVFGSNPEGRHGRGTARLALNKFGAIYGQGRGLQGQSYALVTKNLRKGYREPGTDLVYPKAGLRSVNQERIINNIKDLYRVAREMKKEGYWFFIAYRAGGMNLNGYSDVEMAQMFRTAQPIPKNIVFEEGFHQLVFS